MKTLICMLVVLAGTWMVAQPGADPNPSVFLETPDDGKTAEGLLLLMEKNGRLETDSGRVLNSIEALEKFLAGDGKKFAPRLVAPKKLETKEAYDFFFAVLFTLQKHAPKYSLMIQPVDSIHE